jgi:hypothetical protein
MHMLDFLGHFKLVLEMNDVVLVHFFLRYLKLVKLLVYFFLKSFFLLNVSVLQVVDKQIKYNLFSLFALRVIPGPLFLFILFKYF